MWVSGLILSRLANRYGIYAAIALIIAGSILVWRVQVVALRAEVEKHQNAALQAQERAKVLRSQLGNMTRQLQAQSDAEAARVAQQQQIEGNRNARRQRNSAIMARPENAEVADIVLPPDMLDGLRTQ